MVGVAESSAPPIIGQRAMYQVSEVFRSSSRAVLYRGIRVSDGKPVVIKVLAPQHRPHHFERLKNEYEIAKDLNVPTVVRPFAVETYQGRPALVMEDFGGESLDRQLGVPVLVERALRWA